MNLHTSDSQTFDSLFLQNPWRHSRTIYFKYLSQALLQQVQILFQYSSNNHDSFPPTINTFSASLLTPLVYKISLNPVQLLELYPATPSTTMNNIFGLLILFTAVLAAPTDPKAGKCTFNLLHHRYCIPVPELSNATLWAWDWKTTVLFNSVTCPIGETVRYPIGQIMLDWKPNRTEFAQTEVSIRGKTLSIGREDTPDMIGFRYGENGGCRWNENTTAGAQGEGCGWCDRMAWIADSDKGVCNAFGRVSLVR